MDLTVFNAGDALPNGGESGYLTLNAGDVVLITEGADLYSDRPMGRAAATITAYRGAYDTSVFVDGTLTAVNAHAIYLRGTPSDDSIGFSNSVEIGETGIVRALGDHDSPKHAVRLAGDESYFTNLGQVSANGDGVYIWYADGGAFANHGHISGNVSGARFYESRGLDIVNTGTISGAQSVVIDNSGGTLKNSGFLDGQVLLEGDRAGVLRMTNSGEISAPDQVTIDASDYGGRLFVRNSGDIFGGETAKGVDAIAGSADGDLIRNTGTIFGDVELGGGHDNYIAHRGGIVTGWVYGGDGNDVFRGASADDQFTGGDGYDYLYGRGGDDNLSGGGKDDYLFGGKGDDALGGNKGDDELTGGAGDDTLVGGGGADSFVLKRFNNGQDHILDFDAGAGDVIDISAFNLDSGDEGDIFTVIYAITAAGEGASYLDLTMLGGSGGVLIDGMIAPTDFLNLDLFAF